jgi:uncharacterized protein (UPF0332 family)
MIDVTEIYLAKALASLAGAESEFANARYDNAANRCYYACFQAAIAALMSAGIRPAGAQNHWDHRFVQSQFVGQLINRRRAYPSSLRATLLQTFNLRQAADYGPEHVSQVRAQRSVQRSRAFVQTIHMEWRDR